MKNNQRRNLFTFLIIKLYYIPWYAVYFWDSYIDIKLPCNVNFRSQVAYSDAGVAFPEDYFSNIQSATERFFNHDTLQHSTKQYDVQLKPLLSAFELRTFALTSVRSFLMHYLPLLEPRANMEDEDDFLEDNQEENHADLVVPFKKSVIQIIREVSLLYIVVLVHEV